MAPRLNVPGGGRQIAIVPAHNLVNLVLIVGGAQLPK
jgi:hypothetical protein